MSARLICIATFGLLLCACSRTQDSSPGTAARPEQAISADVAAAMRSAGIDTRVTAAAADLRVRLGALHPSTRTYEVTMKPGTRQIDADSMRKSYLGTTAQGELIFNAHTAPAIADLKPGDVALFAGTALLKVTGVAR